MKLLKKRLKNEKGLTLIELLAVIVILAIVAAIAIPAIGNMLENSRYNAAKSDAINIINAANLYFTEEGSSNEDKVSVEKLLKDNYLDTAGVFEKGDNEKNIGLYEVTRASGGNTLYASDVIFSGKKKVTFNNVTIQDINNDDKKGSEITAVSGHTIETRGTGGSVGEDGSGGEDD